MTEGPRHPRGSAKARAAFYREKAATLRSRAASSWDVTRATLIQAAQIYEGIATSIEEAGNEPPPPSDEFELIASSSRRVCSAAFRLGRV